MAFYRCSGNGGNIEINGAAEQELYVQNDFETGDVIYGLAEYKTVSAEFPIGIQASNYFRLVRRVVTLNNGNKYLFVVFTANTNTQYGPLHYLVGELGDDGAVMEETAGTHSMGYGDSIINGVFPLGGDGDFLIEMQINQTDSTGYAPRYGIMSVVFNLDADRLDDDAISCKLLALPHGSIAGGSFQEDRLRYIGTVASVSGSSASYYIAAIYKQGSEWFYKESSMIKEVPVNYDVTLDRYTDGTRFFASLTTSVNIYGSFDDTASTFDCRLNTNAVHPMIAGHVGAGWRAHVKDNYYLVCQLTKDASQTQYRHFHACLCRINFDEGVMEYGNYIELSEKACHYQCMVNPADTDGDMAFRLGDRFFVAYKELGFAELSFDYGSLSVEKVNDFDLFDTPTTSANGYHKPWHVHGNMIAVPRYEPGGSGYSSVYIYEIKDDGIKVMTVVALENPMKLEKTDVHLLRIVNDKLYVMYTAHYSGDTNAVPMHLAIANIYTGEILHEEGYNADYNYSGGYFLRGSDAHYFDLRNNNYVTYLFNLKAMYDQSGTIVTGYRPVIHSSIHRTKLSREGTIFGIAGEGIAKQEKGTVLVLPVERRSLETELAALSDEIEALSEATDNMEDALDALLISI